MSLADLAALLDEDEDDLASLVIRHESDSIRQSPERRCMTDDENTGCAGVDETTHTSALFPSHSQQPCSPLQQVTTDLTLSDDDKDACDDVTPSPASPPMDAAQREIVALKQRIRQLERTGGSSTNSVTTSLRPTERILSDVIGKIQKPAERNKIQVLHKLPPPLSVIVDLPQTQETRPESGRRDGEGQRLGERLRSLVSRHKQNSSVHQGDTDSSDDEDNRNPFETRYNDCGRAVKRICRRPAAGAGSYSRERLQEKAELANRATKAQINAVAARKRTGAAAKSAQPCDAPADFVMLDNFNKMNLMSRRVSSVDVRECMRDKQLILVSRLEQQSRGAGSTTAACVPDNWVTIGTVVRKSDPRTSQKGTSYSSWTISDLVNCEKPAKVMLFGEAHTALWKTTVGSVVALAGARFLKDRDIDNGSTVVLSVNSSQNCILLGTSADLGFCQAKCKNGRVCLTFVNKRFCPVCVYHMGSEYKKTSSKRGELQGCSGVAPKQRSIAGVGTLTGSAGSGGAGIGGVGRGGAGSGGAGSGGGLRVPSATTSADKQRLASLGYQKATSAALLNRDTNIVVEGKHLSSDDVRTIQSVASTKNTAVGELLMKPCAGARNMLKYFSQPCATTASSSGSGNAPANSQASGRQLLGDESRRHGVLQSTPRLSSDSGAAASWVDLDALPPRSAPASLSINKSRAVELLRRKGGVQRRDPNQVCVASRGSLPASSREAVKRRVDADHERHDDHVVAQTESLVSAADEAKLARIRAAIASKSTHAHTVHAQMSQQQQQYFDTLERKEMIENKMLDTWEIKVKAVYCSKCKYRALSASDLCRAEGHSCVTIDAVKRFFSCRQCAGRTVSLDRLPLQPCNNCGSDNWKRAPMGRERAGPKLDSEVLSIRGNECKHINSSVKNHNLNLEY